MAGFVAMITSRHYPMEFPGWSMIVGMLSAVPLTLATLTALLLLVQRKRLSRIGDKPDSPSDPTRPRLFSDHASNTLGVVAH